VAASVGDLGLADEEAEMIGGVTGFVGSLRQSEDFVGPTSVRGFVVGQDFTDQRGTADQGAQTGHGLSSGLPPGHERVGTHCIAPAAEWLRMCRG